MDAVNAADRVDNGYGPAAYTGPARVSAPSCAGGPRHRRGLQYLLLAGIGLILLIAAALLWPMETTRYLDVHPSSEMIDRNGRLFHAYLNDGDRWCFERTLDELGPRIVDATLAAEDQRFYMHPGVDPVAVIRAAVQDLRHGRVVSGGSTITMQVVKRDGPKRLGLVAKVVQAVEALSLERHATKTAILSAYLNSAPYGMNLEGVEAGAYRYFGKPARELTLSEAALLAGIPKGPKKLMPLEGGAAALQRRNHILRRMLEEGFVSRAECDAACAEPSHAKWHEFPALAPHLASMYAPRAGLAKQAALQVTFDSDIQERAEAIVGKRLQSYVGDVGNAAAMIVDVPRAEVLARVGSGSFFRTPGGGQVDACRAPRSPGSALKPFTYGLAMERNVLYPSETLLDDSLDFGAYSPGNFDGTYNGMVSASEALRYSLNVPAIQILEREGVDNLYSFLHTAGFTTLKRSPERYGLGLTLGNCEVRLDEMMAAYCMLANLGGYRPLTTLRNTTADAVPPRRCLARGTCLALFDMLAQELPGELADNLVRASKPQARVCWKTGTSTGHCDAWAFVFNAQYVVGVWLGNNDGLGSKRLVGITAALPLAARLFRALPPSDAPEWPEEAADLRTVKVCAISGLPATEWCEKTHSARFPAGQFLNRRCDVHYPGKDNDIVERWPGSAKGWDLASVQAPRTKQAESATRREALRILTPPDKAEFVLTGEPNGDVLRLQSSLDAEGALHWYLDSQYLGASSQEKPVVAKLALGEHTLACMTSYGTTDTVTFTVSEPETQFVRDLRQR